MPKDGEAEMDQQARFKRLTIQFTACWVAFCVGAGLLVTGLINHPLLAWVGAPVLAASIGAMVAVFAADRRRRAQS